jgi:asparagine synthase (glutamine-hydrolysing)
MPGITGILGRGDANERTSSLMRMVKRMASESFSISGTYGNDQLGVWVGWTGHQGPSMNGLPFWNETKTIGLIFYGEEFSDPDLISQLRFHGHEFNLDDASYLVHLYEERGMESLGCINGRFSGIIIDLRIGSAHLFNDRYGMNRIYFHEGSDGFYFSSEAKSILEVLPDLRRIDMRSLSETFSCGCALQNRSLFVGISLLPGGSAWTHTQGAPLKRTNYFRPADWEEKEALPPGSFYDIFKQTWAAILPKYLKGKEKMALSLTGGKDSRMIIAWAHAPTGTLPCYSFGGMYRDCQDVKIAQRVARICHQPYQVIRMDTSFFQAFPTLAERAVFISDGAMDVSGSVEIFVNKIAREIASIRLTGNYGQEILRSAISFRPSSHIPISLDREFARLVDAAASTYEHELTPNRLSFVAFKQVPWHHYCRLSMELSQLTPRSPFLDNDLVSLYFRAPADIREDVGVQMRLIAEGNPALAKVGTDRALVYQSASIPDWLKRKYHEIGFRAEYAFDYGMPPVLAKLNHLVEPLRLERFFLGRHKFYHFRIWYQRELSEYIKSIVLDSRSLQRSYLNGREVEKMVLAHTRGTENRTSEIHRILTSELTQRQFVDKS